MKKVAFWFETFSAFQQVPVLLESFKFAKSGQTDFGKVESFQQNICTTGKLKVFWVQHSEFCFSIDIFSFKSYSIKICRSWNVCTYIYMKCKHVHHKIAFHSWMVRPKPYVTLTRKLGKGHTFLKCKKAHSLLNCKKTACFVTTNVIFQLTVKLWSY